MFFNEFYSRIAIILELDIRNGAAPPRPGPMVVFIPVIGGFAARGFGGALETDFAADAGTEPDVIEPMRANGIRSAFAIPGEGFPHGGGGS